MVKVKGERAADVFVSVADRQVGLAILVRAAAPHADDAGPRARGRARDDIDDAPTPFWAIAEALGGSDHLDAFNVGQRDVAEVADAADFTGIALAV